MIVSSKLDFSQNNHMRLKTLRLQCYGYSDYEILVILNFFKGLFLYIYLKYQLKT